MRNLVAASLLLLAACSTASSSTSAADNPNTSAIQPEFEFVQTSSVPPAARYESGPITVQYAVRVTNPSAEAITLERITVQTVSEGAYRIDRPYSVPFKTTIPPGQRETVQLTVPAQTGLSVVGANGPVPLRVTAQFNAPGGKFQRVFNAVANPSASITGDQ